MIGVSGGRGVTQTGAAAQTRAISWLRNTTELPLTCSASCRWEVGAGCSPCPGSGRLSSAAGESSPGREQLLRSCSSSSRPRVSWPSDLESRDIPAQSRAGPSL